MTPEQMEALLEEYQEVQDAIERANAWDLDRHLEVAMDALRVPPGDADVTTLSGGERRRVALARLLLSSPDLLLLDEPTNHLDAESVAWLERFLSEYQGTVVAVTHDRYFLDNVAGWILELDRGRGIPWRGNYSSWLEQKEQRLAVEEKQESARQRTLARELEWVRMNPKARQAKSKARVANYQRLVAEEGRRAAGTAEIRIPAAPRLGDVVVEAEGLRKGFGDRLLIEDLSFSLPPGGIVGVIGPNGAGKTTLFRMIAGQEQPDAGALRVGETVRLAYVDQSREALDAAKTVWEEIAGGSDTVELGPGQRCSRARTWPRSTSAAATSRSRSATSRAASATACTWPSSWPAAATCCCSTSPPTTSTSTRCAPSRTRWRTSRAAPWSSATTAGSSTGSRRTSSPSRATAASCGSRATTRTTRSTGGGSSGTTRSRTASATSAWPSRDPPRAGSGGRCGARPSRPRSP